MHKSCWKALLAFVSLTLAGPSTLAQSTDSSAVGITYVDLGNRYLNSGEHGKAADAFEHAIESGHMAEGFVGLARIAVADKNWSEAEERLQDALDADSSYFDAHYFNAITQRELAKFRTLNQTRHWNLSENEFRWLIEADSLFDDVLYQYALLKQYRGDHKAAIRLAERQVQLKPTLSDALEGVFSIYRHFIHHESPDRALKYLRAAESQTALYFTAEVLRREGMLEEADRVLRRILKEAPDFPVQPLILSQARIRYSQARFDEAESLVNEAIDQLEEPVDAKFLFADFKHVITEDELDHYRSLSTPDDFKAFFRSMWTQRDPLPARSYNVRLAEHYRRLLVAEREYVYDGFRIWHNNPDRLGQLRFPSTYALNDEFNDKGLIFIRHGEPDEREVQVGDHMDFRSVPGDIDPFFTPGEHSYAAGWLPNESWRYHSPVQMDFHFVLAGGGQPNNWRLIPVLTNYQMLNSREHWGARYYQLARAAETLAGIQGDKVLDANASTRGIGAFDEEVSEQEASRLDSAYDGRRLDMNLMDAHMRAQLEFQDTRDRLIEGSRRDVELALSTDQHTWEDEIERIDIPYMLSAFRGEEGRTDVEIDFALPLGKITEQTGANSTVDVEVGYSVHDEAWRPMAEEAEVKHLPATPDPSAASIDFFRFAVAPGKYNLSLFGSPVSTAQMGGYKFEYEAPDYSGQLLEMSDLLLAEFIGPARSGSRFDRGDFHISPNPFLRFSNAQPVYVYFEIYNLTLAGDDQTSFSIDYILKPERPRPKFLGIFGGGDRPAVTIAEERTGSELSPVEHAGIDVQSVDPGPYTLTVRVTDHVTGRVVERSRPLELYTYDNDG